MKKSKQIKELRKIVKKLTEENHALSCRQVNCDSNRQFCDDATNWLGPMSDHALSEIDKAQQSLIFLKKRMEEIHDAYYTAGAKYPWEDS